MGALGGSAWRSIGRGGQASALHSKDSELVLGSREAVARCAERQLWRQRGVSTRMWVEGWVRGRGLDRWLTVDRWRSAARTVQLRHVES
mmetsp:Transcript_132328/g.197170  ORF Transcript_132328/g.197170 Transcript_132328/m.197170 type:complete len:89 (+) Transcript_132328:491-757(+)